MSKIIGIDLGTTTSCVAVLDDKNQPKTLVAADGERTTPSWVAWTATGQVTVGTRARRQAVTNPSATVYGAKRLIGRKVNTEDVAWFAKLAPFRIVAAPNGDAWVRVHGQPISPQEIAAHVLRRMRQVAEEALQEPVTRAVVTVPAYFDDAQRQATRDAGQIAGLDIIRILNEPTAAALAYGVHRYGDGRRLVAVFDLDGGTFDISIMSVDNGSSKCSRPAAIPRSAARIGIGASKSASSTRYSTRIASILPASRWRCRACASRARPRKKRCRSIARPRSNCRSSRTISTARRSTTRRRSRAELVEQLTKDLLDRLEAPCLRALADAGLTEVEEVLLVGGMTRWPAVQDTVERIFHKKPSKGANPDEVVALGAAAYAGILAGDTDDASLLDVTPHDLGIKGRRFGLLGGDPAQLDAASARA